MSYLGTKENAKSDQASVEAMKESMESSPALAGGSSPGPKNAASSGTLTLRRTKGSFAHKGDSVTRKME